MSSHLPSGEKRTRQHAVLVAGELWQQLAVGGAVDVHVPSLLPAASRSPVRVVGDGVHVLALRQLRARARRSCRFQIDGLAVPIAGGEVDAVGRERRRVDRRRARHGSSAQLRTGSCSRPHSQLRSSGGHSASSSAARSNEFSSIFALVSPMRAT